VTPTSHDSDGPAPVRKADPETLVLRGRPRPVVRFKRGLIVGIMGIAAATIIAVTWLALEPASLRMAGGLPESGAPLHKAAPDALANAPASYGEVPRLGPPLPGDLGRPILEHERSLAGELPATPDAGATSEAERRRAAAQAELQRQAAARETARGSPLVVQLAGVSRQPGQAPDARAPVAAAAEVDQTPNLTAPGIAGQPRMIAFSSSTAGDVNPHPLRPPPSPWMLAAGTIVPASLLSGLNSDLPGMVLAQVTENVRDSATGRTVLIPQGARILGTYDSVVAFGQRRALVVWQRILFPDGSSVRLDNVPAVDRSGYAGLEDQVDFHTWRLLSGIALSTILGVGTELGIGGEGDLVRALRESTQQNSARAGEQITSRNLDIQPTMTVRPGWPVRAMLNKDLVLRPWRE